MSKFLPTSGFKRINPEEFDLNKYNNKSSKGCVLEADLEYPKELRELHNDYPVAPDKIEIKREMLSEYHIFFDIEMYVLYYGNLQLYLRLGLKLNKVYPILEFN